MMRRLRLRLGETCFDEVRGRIGQDVIFSVCEQEEEEVEKQEMSAMVLKVESGCSPRSKGYLHVDTPHHLVFK